MSAILRHAPSFLLAAALLSACGTGLIGRLGNVGFDDTGDDDDDSWETPSSTWTFTPTQPGPCGAGDWCDWPSFYNHESDRFSITRSSGGSWVADGIWRILLYDEEGAELCTEQTAFISVLRTGNALTGCDDRNSPDAAAQSRCIARLSQTQPVPGTYRTDCLYEDPDAWFQPEVITELIDGMILSMPVEDDWNLSLGNYCGGCTDITIGEMAEALRDSGLQPTMIGWTFFDLDGDGVDDPFPMGLFYSEADQPVDPQGEGTHGFFGIWWWGV